MRSTMTRLGPAGLHAAVVGCTQQSWRQRTGWNLRQRQAHRGQGKKGDRKGDSGEAAVGQVGVAGAKGTGRQGDTGPAGPMGMTGAQGPSGQPARRGSGCGRGRRDRQGPEATR